MNDAVRQACSADQYRSSGKLAFGLVVAVTMRQMLESTGQCEVNVIACFSELRPEVVLSDWSSKAR